MDSPPPLPYPTSATFSGSLNTICNVFGILPRFEQELMVLELSRRFTPGFHAILSEKENSLLHPLKELLMNALSLNGSLKAETYRNPDGTHVLVLQFIPSTAENTFID
jgi:hypothetical protein